MNRPAYRPLSEVRLTDAASVGGKAASLGDLLAAGILVPDGVVLVSDYVVFTEQTLPGAAGASAGTTEPASTDDAEAAS